MRILELFLLVAAASGKPFFYQPRYSPFLPTPYYASLPATTYSASPVTYRALPTTVIGAPTPFVSQPAPTPVVYTTAPSPNPLVYATAPAPTPVVYATAPAPPQPVVVQQQAAVVQEPVQSRYHIQDELGAYSFGYSGGPSSRAETRDHLGTVRGAFNYVDPDGIVQSQQYIADDFGFRVAGTNIPEAPDAPLPVAPAPVKETPEVLQARAALIPVSRKKRGITPASTAKLYPAATFPFTPVVQFASAPMQYTAAAPITTYGYHTPAAVTYAPSAPAVMTYAAQQPTFAYRPTELLQIVNNPGFATSYRVL